MQDKRDELYNNLIKSGKVNKGHLGTIDQFKSSVKDEATAKKFHENLMGAGFSTDEIGDSDVFYGAISSDFQQSEVAPVQAGSIQPPPQTPQIPQQSTQATIPSKKDVEIFGGIPYSEYQNLPPKERLAVYSKWQGDKDREAKEKLKGANDNQVESLYADVNREMESLSASEKVEAPAGAGFIPASARGAAQRYGNAQNKEKQDKYTMLESAKDLLENSQEIIAEAGKKGDTNFFGGAGRGFRDKAFDLDTWAMGVTDLYKNKFIQNAAEKADKGEALTQEEQRLLDAATVNMATQALFSSDLGLGYKAGGVTAESLPFMLEMIANPAATAGKGVGSAILRYGVKKFGAKAAEKVTGVVAKKLLGNVAKASTRVIGDVLAAGAMTATSGIARTAADAVSRNTGQVTYGIDEEGNAEYAGMEGGVSGVEAAYKAFASNTIENFSEMFGRYFGAFGGVIGKTRPMQALKASKVGEAFSKINSSDWAKTVAEFEKKTNYNGTFGEYGEEVVGTVLNSIFTGDQSLGDLADVDQQIDTFLGVSLMGGFMSSVKALGYRTPKYEAEKNLRKAEKDVASYFGDDWVGIRSTLEEADVEDRKAYLNSVLSSDMNTGEKKAMFEYVSKLTTRDAIKAGDEKLAEEGVDLNDGIAQNKASVYNGYNEAAKKALKFLPVENIEEIDQQIESGVDGDQLRQFISEKGLPENQSEALLDYSVAKQDFNDYINGVQSRIDEEKANARQQMESVSNPDMGATVRVKSAVSETPIHVVGGKLVFNEQGFVDERQSDEVVYYIDEAGERKMAAPSMFESLVDSTPTEELIAQAEADVENGIIAQEDLELSPLEVGQSVYTPDGISGEVIRFTAEGDPIVLSEIGEQVFKKEELVSNVRVDGSDMKKGTENEVRAEEITGVIKNDTEKTTIPAKIDFSDITVDDYINSNDRLTDYGRQTARENEDLSINRAKLQAETSLKYLQGEISAREMVTSPAYEYVYDISDESAEKYAKKESAYWRDKYAGILETPAIADAEVVDSSTPAIEGGEQQNVPENTSTETPSEVAPERTMESLLLELPKKKGGAIDYKAMTPRQTFEYTRFSEGDETAIVDLQADIKDVSDELGKIESKVAKAKGVDRIELREQSRTVKSKLNELQEIMAEVAPVKEETVEPKQSPVMDADMLEWIADNSNDAGELVSAYHQAKEMASHDSKLKPWEQSLLGRKVSTDSFMRFADRNIITGQLAKGWLSKDATSIDQISKEFEMEGIEVSDQEIVDFIIRNPSNYVRKTSDTQNKIGRRFSETASKASGMPIGSPESVTGRLFIQNMQQGKTIEGMRQAAEEQASQEDLGREEVFFNSMPNNDTWTDEQVMDGVLDGIEYRDGEYVTSNDMTSDEIDDIYSQLEFDNNGRETEEAYSQENEFENPFDEAREIEEPGTPEVVAVEDREDKEGDSGVGGLEKSEDYLTIDKNLVSSQHTNQLENNGISESISQGEHGKEAQEGGRQEEPIYQLRRRIEETSRDAQKGEGSRGNSHQEVSKEEKENSFDYSNKTPSFVAPEIKPDEDVLGYAERVVKSRSLYDEEKNVNTEPTQAQKEAGNYKMGHVKIGGHDVTIENPKGSVRRGVNADGKAWETPMNNTYGYFRGTKGKDGDHIDTFLGDKLDPESVYVVDQVNEDGSFDEHKVMYGFESVEDARAAYLSNYEEGWQGLGEITGVQRGVFDEWLGSKTKKRKPFAEYQVVRNNIATEPSVENNTEEIEVEVVAKKSGSKRKMSDARLDKEIRMAKYDRQVARRDMNVAAPKNSPYTDEERKRFEDVYNEAKKRFSELLDEKKSRSAAKVDDGIRGEVSEKKIVTPNNASVMVEYNQNGELDEGTADAYAFSKAIKEAKQKAIATGVNKIEYVVVGGKKATEKYVPNPTKDIWLKAQNPFVWVKEAPDENKDVRFRENEISNLQTSVNEFVSKFMVDDVVSVLKHDVFVEKLKENGIESVEGPAINMGNGAIFIDSSVVNNEKGMKKYVAHEIFHTFVRTQLSVDEVEEVGNEIGEDRLNELLPGYESEDVYQKTNELIAHAGSELQKKGMLEDVFNGLIDSNYVSEWMRKALSDKSISKVLPLINKILSNYEQKRTESKASMDKTERGSVEQSISERRGNGGIANSKEAGGRESKQEGSGRRAYTGEVIRDSIRDEAQTLAKKLHTPIRIVDKVEEIVDENSKLQQRKRDSKGWFDPATGEVVVVLPNATSVEDMQATILHEAVAHKGLRDMFGVGFGDFLDDVFKNASDDIRLKIMNMANGYDGNHRVATEEYLAELAESGFKDEQDRSIWNKIKDSFIAMLRKIGIRIELTDADLCSILKKSYDNLAERGGIGELDNAFEEDGTPSDEILFRDSKGESILRHVEEDQRSITQVIDAIRRINEIKKNELSGRTWGTRVTEGLFDDAFKLKMLQDAVEAERGDALPGYMNPYQYITSIPKRNEYETEAFNEQYMRPIYKEMRAMKDAGASEKGTYAYLYAKSGLERNDKMRTKAMMEYIDAIDDADIRSTLLTEASGFTISEMYFSHENAEKKKMSLLARDYSGLTELREILFDEDSNKGEDRIQEWVDEFENKYEIGNLWASINLATKATLENEFRAGKIDKATKKKIEGMYDYYLPLRKWEGEQASDVWEYANGDQSEGIGSVVKKAFGRNSLASNPIVSIGLMGQQSIHSGNRNELKQMFLSMARNNPNGAYAVSPLWIKNIGTEGSENWVETAPEWDDNPDVFAQNVERFDQEMEALQKEGRAKQKYTRGSVGMPITKMEANEHQVVVSEAGKRYIVYVNSDPAIARAINGIGGKAYSVQDGKALSNDYVQKIIRGNGMIMRTMGQSFTTWNPMFVLANGQRDIMNALLVASVKEGREYAGEMAKNMFSPSVHGAIMRAVLGKADMNNPIDKLFAEYESNGGETGFSELFKDSDFERQIKKELSKKNINPMDVIHLYLNNVEKLNRWAENISRFSTYKASRDSGRDVYRSVYDAKEITVNFNRKGTGACGGNFLRLVYIFSGAGLQAAYQIGRLSINRKTKKKAAVLMASVAVAGYLIPLMNNMLLGGDGDDIEDGYDFKPEYERKSNIMARIGKGKFAKLSIPQELRPFWNIGETLYQLTRGNIDTWEASSGIIKGFAGVMPFDPFGSSGLVPTVLQPIDQVRNNENFFGGKIYKEETRYNKHLPQWRRSFRNTSPIAVGLSKWLNDATGGDEATQGWIDISPGGMESLVEGYFGGAIKFINNMAKTTKGVAKAIDGDSSFLETRNIPFVSSFYTDSSNPISKEVERLYWDCINLSERLGTREREYRKLMEEHPEKASYYQAKFMELKESKDYERKKVIDGYSGTISNMTELVNRDILDGKSKTVVLKQIKDLKKNMLNEINKIK